jgi:hypothetical protein
LPITGTVLRGLALLATVLALLALAACGGDAPAEDPTAVQVASSKGLTTYDVRSQDFSLAVPEDWRTASVDELLDEETMAAARAEAPTLAPLLETLATESSPIKLVAFDPAANAEAFATNVNVFVEPLPSGFTRQRYFDVNLEQLMRLFGPDVAIEEQQVRLPGGWAMRLSYQAFSAGPQILSTVQYVFFRRDTGYVLTYTTLPDRLAEAAEDFERSARTFSVR